MTAPAVSVIVPTYNGGRHVGETMAALLAQDFADFELLVFDDASTDDTVAIVAGFADPRVRIVRNAENLGLAGSMNKALVAARGRYIARCDQDDVSLPDRLGAQVAFLDAHPAIDVLGTGLEVFGQDFGDGVAQRLPPGDAAIKANLVAGAGFIANPTVMYRAAIVRDLGLRHDQTLVGCDDYGLWVDCVAAGVRFANLPQVLLRYRFHETNASKTHAQRLPADARRVRVRALRLFFPELPGRIVDRLGAMWLERWPAVLSEPIAFVQAVAAALDSVQADLGQDQGRVRDLLAHQLRAVLGGFHASGTFARLHAECLAILFPALAEAVMLPDF